MALKALYEAGDYLAVASAEVASSEDRLLVASALSRLGRDSEALKHFSQLEDEIGQLVRGLLTEARILIAQENYPAAERLLERYLAFFPDDDEARDLLEGGQEEDVMVAAASPALARIYAQQGHYSQALGIYAQVLPADASVRKEAVKTQNLFVVKTLEGWLERLKKDENPNN